MTRIAEIWRYPVKSMAGERVDQAKVTEAGLDGDRRYALLDSKPNRAGKNLTARELDTLLSYRVAGGTNGGGVMVMSPAGRQAPIDSPLLLNELEAAAGRPLRLVERPGLNFDDSPILLLNLASLGALENAVGTPIDHRRFRANLYLNGLAPDAELEWLGKGIAVGDAVLKAVKRCERCALITYDPETLEQSPDLLRLLTQVHAARMGIYCEVLQPGVISEGDHCYV